MILKFLKRSAFVKHSALVGVSVAALILAAAPANAAGTLRVGMTISDIPLMTGMADQGSEGQRFVGRTIYDGLVLWDVTSADRPSDLAPGLAESWSVDENDHTRWIFNIRQNARFHDGSVFDAHAAVWNFDKMLNQDSEQFDPRQSGLGVTQIPAVSGYKALDDYTLEITTGEPDATLPYQLTWIMMSSPANWEAQGKDWQKVASNPSGTGPWKFDSFVPRERVELVPNTDHWDPNRVPKLDRLVLVPLPEPNARTAALMSGQVDWIEAPVYDMIPALKANGFEIVTNPLPHNWVWQFSLLDNSPWQDIRVRQAANLAIDREGMKALLGDLMIPAKGFLPPTSQWFGNPSFDVRYDVEAAKNLLAEAGYGPDNRLKAKTIISPSGSGQMLPLPMNEFIQQNLAEIGIDVEFEVVEFNTLVDVLRAGAGSDIAKDTNAINYTYSVQDPFTAGINKISCDAIAPRGTNWGHYCDPEMEEVIKQIRSTFDPAEQTKVVQKMHEKNVDDTLFLMVTHDVAPRAMSTKVKGFVPAQNWFPSLTTVTIEE